MKWISLIFLLCLLSLSCVGTKSATEFPNMNELEGFLASDNTNEIINEKWCCLDYARRLQDNALAIGRVINVQVIGSMGEHVINLCVINNEPFFVDPRTDKVFRLGELNLLLQNFQPSR